MPWLRERSSSQNQEDVVLKRISPFALENLVGSRTGFFKTLMAGKPEKRDLTKRAHSALG
jgi:hypothetical protein